mmetsp:Transcript_23233/g.52383  ORF Transcript_23233/g.52383 Transcript_23233/m.52383 type:complete len:318 (-) Transcript_23233:202-1155(-)
MASEDDDNVLESILSDAGGSEPDDDAEDQRSDPGKPDTREQERSEDAEEVAQETPESTAAQSSGGEGARSSTKSKESPEARRQPTLQERTPRSPGGGSCTIKVTGFVRPFTARAAREMVEAKGGGPLVEGDVGFSMDKIKTTAIATFKSNASALRALAALGVDAKRGAVWPLDVGRVLRANWYTKAAQPAAPLGKEEGAAGKREARPAGRGREVQGDEAPTSKRQKSGKDSGEAERMDEGARVRVKGRGALLGAAQLLRPKHLKIRDLFLVTKAQPPIMWLPNDEARAEAVAAERRKAEASKVEVGKGESRRVRNGH